MKNSTKNITAVILALLIIGSAIYVNNLGNNSEINENELTAEEQGEEESDKGKDEMIDWEIGISAGEEDAPVKVVNFSSYSCPYCARVEEEVFPQLKEEYIDTGKVFYLLKGTGNPDSLIYQSAYCAQESLNEEQTWQYQDLLFSDKVNQASDSDDLFNIAVEEGIDLDENEFKTCLEENRYSDQLETINYEAQQVQLQGTPYLLINGQEVVGYREYEKYKQIIEDKLNENN